jgi:exonuclease III
LIKGRLKEIKKPDIINYGVNMKIVSWNCGGWASGGFNDECLNILLKEVTLKDVVPEIILIQETTEKEHNKINHQYNYEHWYGDDKEKSYKGISIFSNIGNIEISENFNDQFRYVIPYKVSNNEHKFTLFAVWIKPFNGNYLEPLYNAIKYYREKEMLVDDSIIIGDFNTFAKDSNKNLEDLEKKLSPMINCTKCTEFEGKNTYYHGKNKEGKDNYGIDDFCFISENLKDKFNIDINIPDGWDEKENKTRRWKGLSDHSPIIIELNLK